MEFLHSFSLKSIEEIEKNKTDSMELYEELIKTKQLCEKLDSIIENSTDGIFITDNKLKALKINQAYESITGINRQDMIGKSAMLLVDNNTVSVSAAAITINTKKKVTLEQTICQTGKKVLISSNPVFDDSGEVEMVVCNIRDITDLVSLKDKLVVNEEIAQKYQTELEVMKSQIEEHDEIIAQDKKMLDTIYIAKKVAMVDAPVFLSGETGVGKEEIAKFIHNNSRRAKEHFIKINCGAIPENLLESELFGYENGAFTGARQGGKPGLFEFANKGTIFLDEIGELPLDMQVKLLRVLQESEVERIGSLRPIKIDVRVISATNRDLEEMMRKKLFRQDLYYRINVVPITIPPLRERRADIVPLANLFLRGINAKYHLNKKISNSAFQLLLDYPWAGNVRELKNIIERAMIMSRDDYITDEDFCGIMKPLPIMVKESLEKEINLNEILEKMELDYIDRAYDKYHNVRTAAKYLGMKPSTFVRKRKEYRFKYDCDFEKEKN